MTDTRKRILEIFSDVGGILLQRQAARGYELVNLHDVHGFYRVNNELVVHIQGYPGMSKEDEMFVSMRLRDYQKMMQIRAIGRVSVGNEHEANLPADLEIEWSCGRFMPYDSRLLVNKVGLEVDKFLGGRK